jgi:sialate O-acetylesterase
MSLRLPAVFSDHLVLQRNCPIPVWGWAAPGSAVSVTLAGQTARATVDDAGRWMAVLPALPAGGPYELVVSGSDTLRLQDVLIGEVWVCSGQSNMEWPVSLANNAAEEIAAATCPQMRLFQVPKVTAEAPVTDVAGAWTVCSPETIASFSAVGYFFGRSLHAELEVPVGLINSSWGGTVAEAWTSREALHAEPVVRPLIESYEAQLPHLEEAMARYQEALAAFELQSTAQDNDNQGYPAGWADPAVDNGTWPTMALPQSWQSAGEAMSGVLWFRREVDLPAEWLGHDLVLSIGACDKSDQTYVNNTLVGSLSIADDPNAWSTPRVYTVPAALVRPGTNLIAVRVFSHIYQGGMTGPAAIMHLCPADLPEATPLALHGDWQYRIEQNFGPMGSPPPMPFGPGNPNAPCALFNGMIAPLVPYAMRGAIWYQGESNADRGKQYQTLLPAMIRDWRTRWALGDFPFLIVQLANYMAVKEQPGESRWAELREAQLFTAQRVPNVGLAVIIDIGEAADIHPRNKQEVGRRLALNALATTYGAALPYSGPLYRELRVEAGALRLLFDHVEAGLVCQGERLTAFAIAGEDRRFVWADARIDGDTIVVASPQVPAPVAVRYGWTENPACTLYNTAGLPASPFRTDDWPV